MSKLGKTVLIANPAAQLGRGAEAAVRAHELLLTRAGFTTSLDVLFSEAPGHVVDLAAGCADADTVVALGGDGTVHEVVNGLMRIEREKRPALALLPLGSGNDYARTLCMSEDLDVAVDQLWSASRVRADVGCCNGVYFAQTLSFGLDAAIALDTVERRARTGKTGLSLYAAAIPEQLLHSDRPYRFRIALDGGQPEGGEMGILAVQVGVTYGSGFQICPDASIEDGLLDICIAHEPISIPHAALLFLRAKTGKHTGFKCIDIRKASTVELEFDEPLPTQIDGERLVGTRFDIECVAAALEVLRAG